MSETPENFLVFKTVLNYNALTETSNQHIYPLPPEDYNEFVFSLDICIKTEAAEKSLEAAVNYR